MLQTLQSVKNRVSESELVQAGLWVAAFTGVCVLVGLGKMKAETVEMMLFAVIGRASARREGK